MNKVLFICSFVIIVPILVGCTSTNEGDNLKVTSINSSPLATPISYSPILAPTVNSPLPTPTATLTPSPSPTPTNTQIPIPTPTETSTPEPTITSAPPIPYLQLLGENAIAFVVGDWENNGEDTLWIANMDGTGERQINGLTGKSINRLAWSPNGQWLAISGDGNLWIVSVMEGEAHKLVNSDTGPIGTIAWSPDSQKIAFIQDKGNLEKFYLGIVSIATSETVFLTDELTRSSGDLPYNKLVWSPDGKWIAFTPFGWYGLKIIDATDGSILSLESPFCTGGTITSIVWSPQSDRLAVLNYGNGRYAHGSSCILTLNGESFTLKVNGDSSKPYWDLAGTGIYVSAVNFNPDETNLEQDPRLLYFDNRGQFIKRLDFVGEIGVEPQLSPNSQWYSGLIDGGVQLVDLTEEQVTKQKLSGAKNIVRLATLNDLNSYYTWADDNHNMVLMIGDYFTPDGISVRPYGRMYALNIQTGVLTPVTNEHWVKFYEISPVWQ